MKLNLEYPIFAKASGVNSGKLINVSRCDEFDINSVSSSDLPVAFEFKREKGGGRETLRYDEKSDSLFNKVCRVNKIEDEWHGWPSNAGQHPSKYYAAI